MLSELVLQFQHLMQEAVVRLEWQLILLVIIIIVGPYLAKRLRLPGLIGLVIGGLLIGPFGLHLLAKGSLDAIGGIGLLFLMFIAGAELDLNLFERYRSAAISFGLLTFSLPFVLGALAAYFIGLNVAAAILMGSVWASHTLVAYPTVRESGLATNKAVAVTVSATVITDTLALLILAVISSAQSEKGGTPLETIVRLTIGLGALVVWTMVLLPRIARWFYAGLGQERILRFVFVVGALASAGFLAAVVGMEGIVGAFFAGLGLNRLIPNNGRLMESVEFFASSLFIPAFLVMVGMLIDPAVLFNPQTLFIALVFLLALAGGKFLAAWFGGKRSGFGRAEILLMFSLTIAQAAATLAATIVGFEIGLFTDQIVNAVLLVVMVSLVASSIGTTRASKQIEPELMVQKPVGKHVLVPVGLNNKLEALMPLAANLAYADAGIVNPLVVIPENENAALRPQAEKLLAQAENEAKAAMAEVEGELRVDASVPQGIVRALQESDATLVLMEVPARVTLSSYLFGTVIDQIGARTPVAAAAVHFADVNPQRIVLIPGSPRAETGYRVDLQITADIAERLAKVLDLPLHLFAPDGNIPEGITLPNQTEVITVAANAQAVRDALTEGDMAIIPCETLRRVLQNRFRTRIARLDKISLIVAAGPYRLRLSSAPQVSQDTERIINLNTISTRV